MDSNMNPSHEELEKLLEKAQREYQAMLDKMTPEEREQAELKAKKIAEEENARIQKIIDDAAKLTGKPLPEENKAPAVCPNCGAPANGGKFCPFCGSPLQNR